MLKTAYYCHSPLGLYLSNVSINRHKNTAFYWKSRISFQQTFLQPKSRAIAFCVPRRGNKPSARCLYPHLADGALCSHGKLVQATQEGVAWPYQPEISAAPFLCITLLVSAHDYPFSMHETIRFPCTKASCIYFPAKQRIGTVQAPTSSSSPFGQRR